MDLLGSGLPFIQRSCFDEQARRRRQTFFFLVLGIVWMALMGLLIVGVHVSLLRLMEFAVPSEVLRRYYIVASCLGVGIWITITLVLFLSARRVLPLLVGARPAAGIDEQVLANVAEEMQIAAGESASLVMWYVLESPARNAFACGGSVSNGSIVVTRGLLNALNRDELQAVVAHELAHLKNGDAHFVVGALAFAWMLIGATMAAALALIVALAILLLATLLFGKILAATDNWIAGVVGLVLVLGLAVYGFVFLGTYAFCLVLVLGLVAIGVKAASSSISQSREFLADACAAQWTRNPMALASALKRISSGPRTDARTSILVAPLWLDQILPIQTDKLSRRLLLFLFRTHPKIERRIELLREMAGSTAITEAQWMTAIHTSCWDRIKANVLSVLATTIALTIAGYVSTGWSSN